MPSIVEELYSDSKVVRARIKRRSDSLYDVEIEVFVRGNALNQEPSWWSPIDGPKIVTDSLDRARELARETTSVASLS